MVSLPVKAVIMSVLILTTILLHPQASAETLFYYQGEDTGPDGLILSNYTVEAQSRESGNTYVVSFTLTNSLRNPTVILSSRGLFIAAVDPGGNFRSFGSSHQGVTMSPGTSLRLQGTLTPDEAGRWAIWPSYEILVQSPDSRQSIGKMGPDEWHAYSFMVYSRERPDLTPVSLSMEPSSPWVGDEVRAKITVKNIGRSDSARCDIAFYAGGSLHGSVPMPALVNGESVEVTVVWVPPQQGLWDLVFIVDHWGSVAESNEDNNVIEDLVEVKEVDRVPLEIVEGPILVNITQVSATIVWETNKPSSGRVQYGATARRYSYEKAEPGYTTYHRVQLTRLNPSSTYHFNVASVDEAGNRVFSGDRAFQTAPPPDESTKITILDPGVCQRVATIMAEANNEAAIERVEFYLDGVLLYADYAPPYSFTVDTSAHDNGVHVLTTAAFNFAGKSTSETIDVEFLNPKDASKPVVEITFPKQDDKVTGEISVVASLQDDTGLGQVFFRVDGGFEAFKGYPTNPKSDKATFTWDTSSVDDGRHRISVEVYDKDANYGYDTVDVWVSQPPPQDPPKLKVKSHTVTRHGNYFTVTLTLENIGGAPATNIFAQDFLWAFQPISGDDAYATYTACFTPSTMYGDVTITSKAVIHPQQSVTYSYQAVPVLVHPESEHPSMAPTIGDPVRIWYDDPKGKELYEEYELPVPSATNGESIPSSHKEAAKSSDYLIITNPQRLSFYSSSKDVNELLSTMARLARYRSGVLGYTTWKYAYYEQVLQGLIKVGGSWSGKLMDGWTTDGFLLIVGETEIIPSWTRVLGTFETTAGDYTWKVTTDNPYANTYGDERTPELNLARIIGGNAKELRKVIETSLNVLLSVPGYGFDRSRALLVSGFPSNLMGDFDQQVNAVADTIKKKTSTTTIDKIHTPNFAQYSPSTGKMDEAYTDLVVDDVFFGVTDGRDVIFLSGHGNWDHWDKIDRVDVSTQMNPFGWTNPFIFASSCKTGTYSGVPGVSEAFLQQGAVVYLGATESGGWTPYSTKFFETWDLNEPISQAVKQVKAGLGDETMDRIWSNVYHVYGDAKFGAAQSTIKTVSYASASTQPEAPNVIGVEVPDYEVKLIDGAHSVTIPGGYEYSVSGYPTVPTYKVSYSYPRGCQIQDVAMTYRSPPITAYGLSIPPFIITLPTPDQQPIAPVEMSYGWWPDRDYSWSVSQGPESTTLTITLYPFLYNSEAAEAVYHKEYMFAVNSTASSIRVAQLDTDKPGYGAGETVLVDVELENVGEKGEDVIFEAWVEDEETGRVVDVLDLRTLNGLKGKASTSCTWDSAQNKAGHYCLHVELRSMGGDVLDASVTGFTLGLTQLEATDLSVDPLRFNQGEEVEIRYVITNSGDTGVAGAAIIMVQDTEGRTVAEHAQGFTDLSPGESLEAVYVWDSAGAQGGVYRVVCYALYEGRSTSPVDMLIGVDDSPPTISPLNPLQGQATRSQVSLHAMVEDQSQVTRVTFSIRAVGGQPLPGDAFESMQAQPLRDGVWETTLDTSQMSDGDYMLTIEALDAFGNVGEETLTFTVDNAPRLSIIMGEPGAQLIINGEEHRADANGLVSVTAQAANYTVEAQSIVGHSAGSRAVFVEWEDGGTSTVRVVTPTMDTIFLARYRTQHLLTVISEYGNPVGAGWYDEGSEAAFSVSSPTGLLPRRVFSGWSGDADASSASSMINMDGPKAVEASWRTDYIVAVGTLAAVVLAIAALMVLGKRVGG